MCDRSVRLEREGFYIALMDSDGPNGFNVRSNPTSNAYGVKQTRATRERMSASAIAHNKKPETVRRKSEEMKQRWKDPDYRSAKAKENKVLRRSDSARLKTSELSKKMWMNPGHRDKFIASVSKPISVKYPGGREDRYRSLKDALAGTGCSRTAACRSVRLGITTKSGLLLSRLPKTKQPG